MTGLSEMERDVVEAAVNMAVLGNDDRKGRLRLTLLDACVARVIEARAKEANMKAGEWMERRREKFNAP